MSYLAIISFCIAIDSRVLCTARKLRKEYLTVEECDEREWLTMRYHALIARKAGGVIIAWGYKCQLDDVAV